MNTKRKSEISWLNVLFCLLVVLIHVLSPAVSALNKQSWQYAVLILPQRLSFVSVFGFYFLSGVKLTLPRKTPQPLATYYGGRVKRLLLPYLGAALVYYLVFAYLLRWFPFSWVDFAGYLKWGTLSSHFYFLYALFQFILLAPLFRWLSARWSPVILLPIALGITWLSSIYFNSILQTVLPDAYFPYSDRIFTTYLVFFLAGCYVGRNYEAFLELLRKNRALITASFAFFAVVNALVTWLSFSGRRSAPYLEFLHTLYLLSAILFLFDLAVRLDRPLPAPIARVDQASYLIYLYHCLILALFNAIAGRLNLGGTAVLLVLRAVVVYSVSIGGCVLWQHIWSHIKNTKRNF